MSFGKNIEINTNKVLVLSSRRKHKIRFLTSKIDKEIGHWIENQLKKCKGEKCILCKKRIPKYTVYSTPVIDRINDEVVRLRLPISLLRQLIALEKRDPQFKKFYSRKNGRDITIIVKRIETVKGKQFEYSIYPNEKNKVSKKLLNDDPGPGIIFR